MTDDELRRAILRGGYDWIKVRRYEPPEDPEVEQHEDYARLVAHHEAETRFLIDVCRRLAREIECLKVGGEE